MSNVRSDLTPRLGLFKPDPGADIDVWGDELNQNTDILDNALLADQAAALYLPLSGGTLTGLLTLAGAPTTALHAATKAYVDGAPPAGGPYLPVSGGTLTGPLLLAGPPTVALGAATKAYVDGAMPAGGPFLPLAGGALTGPLMLSGPPTQPLQPATKAYVDAAQPVGGPYLALAGGTLTGPLTLAGAPTQPLQPATKQYVDTALPVGGPFLPLSGGTLTGLLTLSGPPTQPLHAATKAYADAAPPAGGPYLALAGGTMTGMLTLAGNPMSALQAVTKQYVDSNYVPSAGGPFLALSGGVMTGALTLAGAPTTALQAATKAYVDGALPVGGPYLALAGGVMTGALTLAGAPTVALHAATKAYVDAALPVGGPYLALAGGVMTGALTLAGAPTVALHAATKAYVDAALPVGGPYLPLAGGTVAGVLAVSANVTAPAGIPGNLVVMGADATIAEITVQSQGTGANAVFQARRSLGTAAAPSAVTATLPLLNIAALGYGATGWSAAGRGVMIVRAAENWSDTAQGAVIAFSTTPVTTTATAEAMRLDDSGALLIGLTTRVGNSKLQVVGGATVDTFSATGQAQFAAPSGFPVIINEGTTVPSTWVGATGLAIVGVANTRLLLDAYATTSGGGLVTGRLSGGTAAAPTGTPIGLGIMRMTATGYGATGYRNQPQAGINLTAAETWTDTANGTYIDFQVTPVTTTAIFTAMRLQNDGALTIGTTAESGTAKLQVTGGGRLDVLTLGASTGPTFTTGAGAPAATAPAGSQYIRNDGTVGARVYINQNGSTTWAAIAGV
jgi:hypothetical protein